jgi:hypothetical protein
MRAAFAAQPAVNDGIHLALVRPEDWEVVYVAMDITNSRRCHLQFFVPRFTGVGVVGARVRTRRSAGAHR